MTDYIKIKLSNGDDRHLPLTSGSRHSGMVREALETAFGQIVVRTAEGTMVVAAQIVEAGLALDEKDVKSANTEWL